MSDSRPEHAEQGWGGVGEGAGEYWAGWQGGGGGGGWGVEE